MLTDFENILKIFFSSDAQGVFLIQLPQRLLSLVGPHQSQHFTGTAKGVRGLRNLGNTCFLNSVLQAVSSCPSFVAHVQSLSELGGGSGTFSKHLHHCLTGNNWICLLEAVPHLHSFIGPVEIRNNDTQSPYNPHHVRRLLAKFNPDFEGNDEQVASCDNICSEHCDLTSHAGSMNHVAGCFGGVRVATGVYEGGDGEAGGPKETQQQAQLRTKFLRQKAPMPGCWKCRQAQLSFRRMELQVRSTLITVAYSATLV